MPSPAQLVVFSDDWGRHPSSCQHLIGQLLPDHATWWVNTIGTRSPSLTWEDAGKAFEKLRQWMWLRGRRPARATPEALTVLTPRMWPGFRAGWQRRLNASLMTGAIHKALPPRDDGQRRVAVTTLPITADLVGRLDVDRWVYYCVDDFSVWPGLDGSVLEAMERQQVGTVDAVVAVSQTLRDRLTELGRGDSRLLTHGIDLKHWRDEAAASAPLPGWWANLQPPVALFWGLIDRRLDSEFCKALGASPAVGSVVLVGPSQSPDPAVAALPRVHMPGPVPYDVLPALAAKSDVLIMPYADLPVTRAMQPLKFKEYLATGKPVIARDLPATRDWSDAADLVATAEQFVQAVKAGLARGLPDDQATARRRLEDETWQRKAHAFEAILLGED